MKIGPYETLRELGRGGVGVVYEARTPEGASVAVKVLLRTDADRLARFERERRLVQGFTIEDGFVPHVDLGRTPEGVPYLVMPFVPGGTLRQRLAKGPLGVAETLSLGRALSEAMGRAHERGVVHRDLKPENILFTHLRGAEPGAAESGDGTSGTPLIADLGLAKHYESKDSRLSESASLSSQGATRGTVGYMAAEQMRDAKSVGPRSDVFALGAILYECLAGRPPFEGADLVEVVASVLAGRFAPLREARPDTPRAFAAAIEKALSLDPEARFADAGAFARALRASPQRGKTRRAALVAGAFVSVLGVGVGALWLSRPAPVLPPTAVPPPPTPPAPRTTPPPVKTGATEPQDATAWLERAKARLAANDWEGAFTDATRAIELDQDLAGAWLCRGSALIEKGDLRAALLDLEQAIELAPLSARAIERRARARGSLGDLEGALADLDRAIELDPKDAGAWGLRGIVKTKTHDPKGAIADLERAVALAPGASVLWSNLGGARNEDGDYTRALADCARAIELDPKNATGWCNRGRARSSLDDLDGALADQTKALELEPRNLQAWINRGVVKVKKGDWEGAIADLDRGLALDPKVPAGLRARGMAKERRGDTEGALADYRRAIKLQPDPLLETEIARLEKKLGAR